MVKRTCPFCGGDSYSASEKGHWICPYCDKIILEQDGGEPSVDMEKN